jgi:hypothetical protein
MKSPQANKAGKIQIGRAAVKQMLLTYLGSVLIAIAVFSLGLARPEFRRFVPGAFAVSMLAYVVIKVVLLVPELSRPLNYRSIVLSVEGLEYEDNSGRRLAIRWNEITSVKFMRYFEWDQQRSWIIIKDDGQMIEISDEWPDRRKLLFAFRRHLSGFNARQAKHGFHTWKTGKWICFEKTTTQPLLK